MKTLFGSYNHYLIGRKGFANTYRYNEKQISFIKYHKYPDLWVIEIKFWKLGLDIGYNNHKR